MISKKELLQKVRELSGVYLSAAATLDALIEWVNSLPDDQPDLLPFQWPIPDGMEVCYYNERKFYYVLTDVVYHPNASKEYCDVSGIDDLGHLHLYHSNDLFLRRKEKKVWVVEWKAHNGISGKNYFDTINEAQELCKRDERYHSSATIYEATLKPVV